MENRFLRVIVLPDGETVHNAFFDRRLPKSRSLKAQGVGGKVTAI